MALVGCAPARKAWFVACIAWCASHALPANGDAPDETCQADTCQGDVEVKAGDAWSACQKSCEWENLGFIANTSEARALYKGCKVRLPKSVALPGKPEVIMLGQQKGGTDSIKLMFQHVEGFCFYVWEGHFWDQWKWASAPVSAFGVRKYHKIWRRCPKGWIRMEKTPSLTVMGWPPLRICEAYGEQKLLVLLRNPIKRAYSGFYQGVRIKMKLSPETFDLYARIEVALVQNCTGSGLPSGDPEKDAAASPTFKACCTEVAKAFRDKPWPGCDCQEGYEGPKSQLCTQFGHRVATAVRRGIYVHYLRNYLRYHRAENLLIYKSEEMFEQTDRVFSEVGCFANPATACNLKPSEVHNANSATIGKERMWKSTEKLLKDFYEPYNKELEELIGRKMNWW